MLAARHDDDHDDDMENKRVLNFIFQGTKEKFEGNNSHAISLY